VVLEARDAREGLALCAGHQGPIDLLVTDLTMAELNGHELAERAIQLRPGLKVLFLSGHTEDVVLKKGSHAFLQNPSHPLDSRKRSVRPWIRKPPRRPTIVATEPLQSRSIASRATSRSPDRIWSFRASQIRSCGSDSIPRVALKVLDSNLNGRKT